MNGYRCGCGCEEVEVDVDVDALPRVRNDLLCVQTVLKYSLL